MRSANFREPRYITSTPANSAIGKISSAPVSGILSFVPALLFVERLAEELDAELFELLALLEPLVFPELLVLLLGLFALSSFVSSVFFSSSDSSSLTSSSLIATDLYSSLGNDVHLCCCSSSSPYCLASCFSRCKPGLYHKTGSWRSTDSETSSWTRISKERISITSLYLLKHWAPVIDLFLFSFIFSWIPVSHYVLTSW